MRSPSGIYREIIIQRRDQDHAENSQREAKAGRMAIPVQCSPTAQIFCIAAQFLWEKEKRSPPCSTWRPAFEPIPARALTVSAVEGGGGQEEEERALG